MAVAKKTTSNTKAVKKIAAPLAGADLEPVAKPVAEPPVPKKTAPSGAAAKKTRSTAVAAQKTASTADSTIQETPSKKTVRVKKAAVTPAATPEVAAQKTTAVKKKRLVTVKKAPHKIKTVAAPVAAPIPEAVIINGVLQPQTTIHPNAPWPFRQDVRKK